MEKQNLMTDPMREQIYLAALLHDIGKFYQRSDTGAVKTSKRLSTETKNNISTICPVDRHGNYGYKHVLWTAQFIEDHREIFRSVITYQGDIPASEKLEFLSAGHHIKPSPSDYSRIIQQADHCSSGMDRSQIEINNDEKQEKTWDDFMKIPLRSLFAGAYGERISKNCDFPPVALNTSKWYFPSEQKNVPESYSAIWNQFEESFKKLPTNNYDTFVDSLYYSLFKYTSNVPSSTTDYPDISLFDHLKTTAAIALCIYDYNKTNAKGDEFLLVGADVSGIQSFIYDISSKGASKNLKGRSFYIQVLLQTIATSLLQELNLRPSNIIYNSGGGFYLLAPNTPEIKAKLGQIEEQIERQIFLDHGTSLYVAIAQTQFGSETLLKGSEKNNLGIVWTTLSQELNKQKRQRYTSMFRDYDVFFKPQETGGTFPKDAITGEEFTKEELKNAKNPENVLERIDLTKNASAEALKPFTASLIQLGRWMKDADYWIITNNQIPDLPGHFEPIGLGVHHYFLSETEAQSFKSKGKGFDNVLVLNLTTTAGGEIELDLGRLFGNNISGFDFYGGNYYPTDHRGDSLSFDELCEGDFKRLGVLRMDVDNLGTLFKEGYPAKLRSFSRLAGLSRSLDWFFKGYLNTIIQSKDQYKEKCFVIYSGGDDLFIIGQWNVLLSLSSEIQTEFTNWVCYNPSITISGGMAMVTGKYPIMKAADLAGEAEDSAKRYRYPKSSTKPIREKNAITFLERALSWDVEFKIVKSIKDELVEIYQKDDKMPRSLLGKIASHFEMANIKNGEIKNPKTYWMLAYDFGRMRQRIKDETIVKWINECINDIHQNTVKGKKTETDYHSLELYYIASRWTELELRTLKN